MTVFETECGHGRSGTVDLDHWKCERCSQEKLCLGFDSSDGEYGYIFLCRDCLLELFETDAGAEPK